MAFINSGIIVLFTSCLKRVERGLYYLWWCRVGPRRACFFIYWYSASCWSCPKGEYVCCRKEGEMSRFNSELLKWMGRNLVVMLIMLLFCSMLGKSCCSVILISLIGARFKSIISWNLTFYDSSSSRNFCFLTNLRRPSISARLAAMPLPPDICNLLVKPVAKILLSLLLPKGVVNLSSGPGVILIWWCRGSRLGSSLFSMVLLV